MKTEVYWAKKENKMLIAYQNAKKQNVFLQILKANYAPSLEGILICDNSAHEIETVIHALGFKDFSKKSMTIGIKKRHIWKPFLQQDPLKELNYTIIDLCRAKRDLGILIQKLQDILLYVEPCESGLKTYSHKMRELLILACTELECTFKTYNLGKNQGMKDYVKILSMVNLAKHKLSLVGYTNPYKCCPFEKWNAKQPTKSLPWYDAYNQVKHNKGDSFHLATLENCINAIAANIVLFAVRYSPTMLYKENDICSNLVRNSLDFRLEDSDDFYIPIFEGVRSYSGAFSYDVPLPDGTYIKQAYDQRTYIPFVEG